MTDGVVETTVVEPTAAPGPETTAAPAPVPSPEGNTPDPEQQPEERKFSQADVDSIVGKRLARERRSWEREQAAAPAAPAAPAGELKREDFDSDEAYIDAKADRLAEQKALQREAEAEYKRTLNAHADREEKAREKFEDYDTVVSNPSLPISDAMAALIRQSDLGPELAYHLGQNPTEAERIFRLPLFLQAKEMGRLEAKVASEPPTRKTSSAPAPITPIRTPASKPVVHDTTDPRSIQSMSTEEWIAAENKREQARLEARFH